MNLKICRVAGEIRLVSGQEERKEGRKLKRVKLCGRTHFVECHSWCSLTVGLAYIGKSALSVFNLLNVLFVAPS